ncbi:3-oxoacyl-[acyl-carrier-protein] synthase-3 [Chitinophaga sp. CF118]|uniref:3-oxoacyl-ACP synthase III family protein n=1 Tax=Chitinophaga sp. CF118 TaxID=1884367 RepID=UPI0008E2A325|nr:ketoacyl-ACP synthase III [Chitinophaga sp. CF118]SFE26931.1 3-oxoacyl-[acyl-carrier-protein] synthase-3 [Chitinophaga sp. CF118]
MHSAYIIDTTYFLPEILIDNERINAEHPEWSVDKISAKTGIEKRYYAKEDQTSGDLAYIAAEQFFEKGIIEKSKVDFLILCTQSPDYFLPTTACILQDRLGLSKGIGAFDFNLGCSGFVYGLGIAKGLVSSGQAKNVLLITAETYSRFINPNDKKNKTIFGDAATATLISSEPVLGKPVGKILHFSYGTDGSGAKHLIVKNGALRNMQKGNAADVYVADEFYSNDDYLFMDGKQIFDFTVFNVPGLVNNCLQKNEVTLEDIDLYIFHQANEFMLDRVRRMCKIPAEKFYIFIKDTGNTVSSTIPIALNHALENNVISKGNKVLLCGFGVGLSMGATLLEY